ncbi:single-stranded-DNA-specific exonuclease RecJ [Paenactinomyces guangxiensis]|uniref:Single-stranded-DNA-specific exonuclease RecJ n=1 Tax=Paenactinomyces guangxiensis TaxID=1490290 RepID=A0A7W1WTH1_9BACL|nr:single-stranded-DNA-specific exonuclease RecJ [Paenactinomyces guangxiensis]MBA4495742.1 single-stranded-DNA-specific exonuclease RecJ [Paenactinomyces guangxiensis]MBH8592731.1 single-stranded-DNA-specific exonuclease RecJ [Paenactinomyces guangxiensis]
MLRSKTRWQPAQIDPDRCRKLSKELNIHPTVARMLIRREIDDAVQAKRFLNPRLDDLYDPFLLDGMHEAVERIHRAIRQGEKILVYGDYDADGVSSTSLMIMVLRQLGADVDYYIPNRFREGYGINKEALQLAKERGFQLIISVDTGISAVMEAGFAKELGLDLIITDHHEPPETLPDALAVINPKKPACSYPFDKLAGVGVAFKLATALLGRVPEELLEIVALGTIADLVPLVDENRVFATYGLKRMNLREHVGIAALLEVSGIDQDVSAGHVGFSLGPRINASGRLDSANQAVDLLVTKNWEQARLIAEELNLMNRERQQLVEEMAEEAVAEVEASPERHRHVIVVAKEGWNVGVIGIVASRLVEKYYRPVIVLGVDEESKMAKGSARSIAGFDMYKALTACRDLLPHYGGHYMAAGMTLPTDHLPSFHDRLTALAKEWLAPEDYTPLTVPEEELTLDQIQPQLIDQLQALAPYGMGNPTPLFVVREANITRVQLIGQQKQHLKLYLEAGGHHMDAVGFRLADLAQEMAPYAKVQLLGELQMNEWNGKRTPQLLIRDLSIPHLQVFDWRSNRVQLEWLSGIEEESYRFICAKSCSQPQLIAEKGPNRVIFWEDLEIDRWEEKAREAKNFVFVDPPPSMELFIRGLSYCREAERLYFIYGDADFDDLLVKVPTREQFKRLYQALAGKGTISISRHMPSLMRVTGLQKRPLSFMIHVFEELGFLRIEQGLIHVDPHPIKKALTESKLYQRQLAREQVLQTLVYSSYRELCNYLLTNVKFKWHLGGKNNGLQREDSGDSRFSASGNSV